MARVIFLQTQKSTKMKSLSGVGLGLSLVFGCLLVALVAELYYLLWWKKRIIGEGSNIDENGVQIPPKRGDFLYIFCCGKKPTSSLRSTAQALCSSATLVHEPQASNSNKDSWPKPFGEQSLENLPVLPRFLFTITEETREDLESEDGVSRHTKQSTSRSNLSDLLQILETPFLTPVGSPLYFTPPLTPSLNNHGHQRGFGPFFEAERDAAFNRMRCSPPPKFKFLRDAEAKLIQRRKVMEQTESGALKREGASASVLHEDEENGPLARVTAAKSQEQGEGVCQHIINHSNALEKEIFSSISSSHLLPLVSSHQPSNQHCNRQRKS